MRNLILLGAFLLAEPALAQTKPVASRADPCAPIGRTADGKLVYSMKCDDLPSPPPPPRVEAVAPLPPVEEESKGGLFRNPFPSLIRPSSAERTPGLGPAAAGP